MLTDLKHYFIKRLVSVLFMGLLVIPITLLGQQKNVSTANQQWIQYYAQVPLNDHWSLLADGGHRWRDGFEESAQYIARLGAGYSFDSVTRISAGLAQLGFFSDGALDRTEVRPYQEVLLKKKFRKISLSHRYRVEERFLNAIRTDGDDLQSSNSFNVRFRYAITLAIPLFTIGEEQVEKEVLLNIGNEIFINAGKEIIHNIFDQNRLMVSPSLRMNENLTVALTWNYQFASTSAPGEFVNTNVIWLQVRQKLRFGVE